MNKNLLIGLGVLLAVVIAGIVFTKSPKPSSAPSSNFQTPGTAATSDTGGKINEIKVSAKEFAYTPSVITVNKGERVRITLINDGATDHDLSIQGLGVATKIIASGESDSIDFTPAVTGSFTFICTVGFHKDLGLTGTLEVK